MRTFLAITIAAVLGAAVATSQTTTNVVVTPSSPVFDCENISGVPMDSAPGFPFGSFASTGGPATTCKSGGLSYKTDMYFPPESLFGGRSITVGDVSSISYWTKKGTTHAADTRDWFLVIYTQRYNGQLGSSFYGVRIGTEPYLSADVSDPINTWNQWTTSGPANKLRFFESTYNYFGSYTDPDFTSFVTGTSLAGSRGPGVPYATQPILYFSVQTATAWAANFTGQVDGLRIQLKDGSVAAINFEPFLVATDKESCKQNGWTSLKRADGSTFKNQGDCVQYVNTGK